MKRVSQVGIGWTELAMKKDKMGWGRIHILAWRSW